MSITQRFKDSSQRLVDHYGTIRQYTRYFEEEYDVDTQTMLAKTEVYSVKSYKTAPKERELRSPNLVNREAAVMLIAAKSLPFKPKLGDTISEVYLDDENIFRVEVVNEAWAGDSVAMWRLVCTQN